MPQLIANFDLRARAANFKRDIFTEIEPTAENSLLYPTVDEWVPDGFLATLRLDDGTHTLLVWDTKNRDNAYSLTTNTKGTFQLHYWRPLSDIIDDEQEHDTYIPVSYNNCDTNKQYGSGSARWQLGNFGDTINSEAGADQYYVGRAVYMGDAVLPTLGDLGDTGVYIYDQRYGKRARGFKVREAGELNWYGSNTALTGTDPAVKTTVTYNLRSLKYFNPRYGGRSTIESNFQASKKLENWSAED